MAIATQVLARMPTRFDMCGQRLSTQLRVTDGEISSGLAKRLLSYAERTLDDEGFLAAVDGWEVTVGTNDAHEKPSDRVYWVTWTNPKGASLSVNGILTSRGWPSLDHGLDICRA